MISNRTKILGLISAVFFIAAACLLVGIVYLMNVKEHALRDKQAEVERSYIHEQELTSLVRLVEDSGAEREELMSRILKSEEVIDFLSLLSALGKEQGVNLETPTLNEVAIDDVFSYLVIDMSITGPYEAIRHVLSLLEVLPYQSSVTNVSLSSRGNGTWAGKFSIMVTKFK